MKIKHLLLGLFAVAATVACEELVETPSLDVDKTAVSVEAVDGQASFNVTSNQSWVATADADWVSLEPASGDASKEAVAVTVKAGDNDTEEVRNATVTVTAGELTKTVKVTQAAAQSQGPELPVSEWALVGSFGEGNNWNAASDLYLSVLDEEYFVYYGIELTATTEFKFLKGGAWPDQGGVEVGGSGLVEPNTIQNTGTSNIKATVAGTFDIYLAADLDKFYIMEVGKLPSEAVEPSPIENQWGMMGCFVDNQWGSDVPMTVEGEWIVAKGAQFTELTFKIRANASWIDATNIGVVPGSEKGVVNGKVSVVTAEYCKANNGADCADIKLNGAAGTYDVYFSFENLEVYVMEEGFKPGEKEPQNPDPVEVTYTVVGTIEDNLWSNNAAIGLMALEGDYYVAKNLPLKWSSSLYDDNPFNGFELKICETGSWTAYCHNELSPSPANTEIEVVYGAGANIQVEGPEGYYDVYFDKANGKLWVMNAGLKPGDKAPVVGDFDVDGKQWVFYWDAMQIDAVFDLGVSNEGMFYFAYDMTSFGYEGMWYPVYTGTYSVEKLDGVSGILNITLIDQYDPSNTQDIFIPYEMTAEDAATFDTEYLMSVFATASISAKASAEKVNIEGTDQGGGEDEILADGEYWIISNNKVATPISGLLYGNLQTVDAVDGKSTAANAFKFRLVDAAEYLYTIQDSNGMYLYQTEGYDTFDISESNGGYADPYCWMVYPVGDGTYMIANYNTMETVQLNSVSNVYGVYGDMLGTYPALVPADDPIAEAELSEWGMIGSWTDWATDQPMYVEGLYAVAKGVEFDATTEFKFRRNASWADADVIGAKSSVGVDLACPALHPGSNIILGEAGTYDVYLDVQNLMFYIMTPGKTPGQALEPSLSSVVVYCAKFSDWDNNYLYTYDPQLQTWPGMLGESVDVNGTPYYKWVIEGVELGSSYNAIFTNNQGNQTIDITGLTFQSEQWFAISSDLVNGKNAAVQTDGPVTVLPDVWGVAGGFNGWDAAATVMDEEGDWYVAKNLALGADGFKFVKNKSWAVNLTADATVAPNVEFAVVSGDGKGDTYVDPAGTYDVYLAKTLDKAYVMTPGYKPGETPAPEVPAFEAGSYFVMDGNGKVVSPIAESSTYGYWNVTAAVADGDSYLGYAENVFTIKAVEGGYTIQDVYGRYHYMTTYNSFSVSKDTQSDNSHVWTITLQDDGTYAIVNTVSGKTVQFSSYGNYAPYTDVTGALPYLVKADKVAEKPSVPEGEADQYATTLKCTTESSSYTDGVATVNGVPDVFTLKFGTSKKNGKATITVPAGTTEVTYYAVGWKGTNATLQFSVGGNVVGTQAIAANSGATGNSPYTITVSDSDHYTFSLGSALEADTEVTVETTGSAYRAIVFAIQAK